MGLISQTLKKFRSTTKRTFYDGKTVVEVEWWVSYCSEYPDLSWARLRVFSDGSADAAFEERKLYGFDSREYAGYFLGEDEYVPFNSMDELAPEIGAKQSDVSPPSWDDDPHAEFKYLGTY